MPAPIAANEKPASGVSNTSSEANIWETGMFTLELRWGNDYMHQRYYSNQLARFVSVDPVLGDVSSSQSWNRYSYVRNNPVNLIDPTGETISLAGLNDEEREKMIQSLNDFTGNTYTVDDDDNLIMSEVGEESSATATDALNEAIGSERVFSVEARNRSGWNFGGGDHSSGRILVDFADFENISYGKVNPNSFSLGSHLMHELGHASRGLHDPPRGAPFGTTGDVVDWVNTMRSERGFNERYSYSPGPGSQVTYSGRLKIAFTHDGRIVVVKAKMRNR